MYTPKRAGAVSAIRREKRQETKSKIITITVVLVASAVVYWNILFVSC